ncbi:MAG: hypothetical protein IKZ49_01950, partial [Alphaproteobacteria bacterium]|nr:hypothetical protein [Alphaproteobacteria bacterium]
MNKKMILFCTGLSGSGKTYFIDNILPKDAFYNLKSATTRPMREGEKEGGKYYYRDEAYFDTEKFATHLWVNESLWKPGEPKWMYGVPEFEILNHLGQNFTYDVIEPKYVRQMINWFNKTKLNTDYDYRILWFIQTLNGADVVKQRQNMPNDLQVRKMNTCNLQDFDNANLAPDHIVVSNPYQFAIDKNLRDLL